MQTGFTGYASRFVDPALGLATGWNYWFKYVIVVPVRLNYHRYRIATLTFQNQLTAAALVIRYWNTSISVAVWITIFIILILIINFAGVKYFGESESHSVRMYKLNADIPQLNFGCRPSKCLSSSAY